MVARREGFANTGPLCIGLLTVERYWTGLNMTDVSHGKIGGFFYWVDGGWILLTRWKFDLTWTQICNHGVLSNKRMYILPKTTACEMKLKNGVLLCRIKHPQVFQYPLAQPCPESVWESYLRLHLPQLPGLPDAEHSNASAKQPHGRKLGSSGTRSKTSEERNGTLNTHRIHYNSGKISMK